jgi:hypothetical protein
MLFGKANRLRAGKTQLRSAKEVGNVFAQIEALGALRPYAWLFQGRDRMVDIAGHCRDAEGIPKEKSRTERGHGGLL